MLNKDQYNQDEYNDYYKQETEGAEIKGFSENENGLIGKLLLFLGLIALGVVGYFGFKLYKPTTKNSSTTTKEAIIIKEEDAKTTENTIEEKVIQTIEKNKIEISEVSDSNEKATQELKEQVKAVEDKIEKTIQQEVATQVQEKLENNQRMSTEDISKIVNIVIDKMDNEKIETTKTDKDNALVNALKNSHNNREEIKPKIVTSNTESAIEEKRERDSSYNKVTVSKDDKELNELSEQIKKLLNMAGISNETNKQSTKTISTVTTDVSIEDSDDTTTSYEESISKEIEVRSNEMRIIIVKPGDTLNKIAKRAYGDATSYQQIFDANPDILNQADRIYVGQKLRIPE